jgi:nicotinamide-nucleotide adenylyltransferase
MRALLLGRFQPFHLGHLKVISDIVKGSEYIVIAIGSTQYSHTLVNPFTAGERYTMISRTLQARGIENYHMIGIEDIHRYAVWVSHVVSQTPSFDVVYAHNPLSVRLFSEADYNVVELALYEPEKYSGTEVRRRMVHGEDWRNLVPEEVAKYIEEIHGVERLRTLAGEEG